MVRNEYGFHVIRNGDRSIFSCKPDALIIGPGPMTPADTGVLPEYFSKYVEPNNIPVFGVCLGMQYLAHREGLVVGKSTNPKHGAAEKMNHVAKDLFKNVNSDFSGARYNSLEVQQNELLKSKSLKILAKSADNNTVMSLRHVIKPWAGVQFHPESFLTTQGDVIIDNFFKQYVES